jgi:hypothetical protein
MGRTTARKRAQRATDIINLQTAALAAMNKPLRQQLQRLETLSQDSRDANLRYYYDMGRLLLEVQKNADNLYGERPIPLVIQSGVLAKRTVFKVIALAKIYTEQQFQDFADLRNEEANFSLHWGHLQLLLALPTAKERSDMAKRAVAELWDPPALGAVIKKRSAVVHGGGRPHKMPATVHLQVRQVLEATRAWATKYTTIWNGDEHNVFGNLIAATDKDVNAEDLENLMALQELIPVVGTQLREMRTFVSKGIRHVEKLLQARAAVTAQDVSLEQGSARQTRRLDLTSTPVTLPEALPVPRKRRTVAASA